MTEDKTGAGEGAGTTAMPDQTSGGTSVADELAKGAKEAGEALAKELVVGVSAPEPAGDPEVMVAFALGWQMSELYNPGSWPGKDAQPDADLPGLGELGGSQRANLGLTQVQVGLKSLEDKIKAAGLDVPSVVEAEGKLPAAKLEDAYLAAIFKLHVELLTTLTATHFKLGKSYGLGRALADTTRLPGDLESLHKQLQPHRVATLRAWISDLTSLLPPHAGHSVNDSLNEWVAWAKTQAKAGAIETKNKRLLRRQGERWRALLSGEKQGTDDLKIAEYVDAGVQAFSQTGTLASHFARRFVPQIGAVLILIAGSLALVLTNPNAGEAAAGALGLLASIGITWKGVGATLGKAAAQAERPIWEAALDVEIVKAISLLPTDSRVKTYTPPTLPHEAAETADAGSP
jgi:hypothetical protein